ncbi:MAG: hypothetical protein C5B57_13890 [Blastocatellia bacterium]|nr:MAG: hypothetical protein C5B57_13890 [Blastocatellia bacterium]
MINYTERLAHLMQDVVTRVPTLSFIDPADLLVFARAGRTNADGPFATCHCLTLPPSEQGYYFWRDRSSGRITRRSEWFVTKSPVVTLGGRQVKYMISFALPRFCDQSVGRTRKERLYPGGEPWLAKLDTVVHELFHIDPDHNGIRRIEREDGTYSAHCHGDHFFQQVADMVSTYLDSRPEPEVYDFLRHDFDALDKRFGGVVATTFRTFPSFPQRYIERAEAQPTCDEDAGGVVIEPLRLTHQPTRYRDEDLCVRRFCKNPSRGARKKAA